MNPQDHNKTLGIIYSFLGVVLAIAAFVMLSKSLSEIVEVAQPQFNSPSTNDPFPLKMGLISASCAIIFLSTAYGLFRKKRWARIAVLIFACVFVWLFPLGTILAAYSWWFMHSEGARQLYAYQSHVQ